MGFSGMIFYLFIKNYNYYIIDIDARYSASIESIRAQSVALGDLCMTDDTPTRSRRGTEIDITSTPSKGHPPPASPSVSNLSTLLHHHHHEQNNHGNKSKFKSTKQGYHYQQQDEEFRPLLEQVDTGRTSSTQYHSIDADNTSLMQQYPSSHQNNNTAPSQQQQQQQQQHYNHHHHYSSSWLPQRLLDYLPSINHKQSGASFLSNLIKRPLECIPAVILGLLLNLLDAISYGNNNNNNNDKGWRE